MNDSARSNNKDKNDKFKCRVTTPLGVVHCEKDKGSPITLHGFLPHFAHFLHEGGQYEELIKNCPLEYKSNNAPEVKDVIGTILLSILAGHKRYCHASTLYGDDVATEILGLNKIVSHDSLERALDKMDKDKAEKWLKDSYRRQYEALLGTPYILDLDPTVKVLYGNQEKAEVGYNPHKPGRKSHCLHAYFISHLRILLDVEVYSGKETAGIYSHKRLWSLLDEMPPNLRPKLIRGDIGYGNEGTMLGCEGRSQPFLFKLKQTPKIKRLLLELEQPGQCWVDAGKSWLGSESKIQLTGWSSKRRVIILKRKHQKKKQRKELADLEQLELPLVIVDNDDDITYEYQILITSTDYDIPTIAQLYRDRGDCENNFDELKNHWGWGGFNSRNHKRTQIMMKLVGLVYNYWNIFCRLAEPDKHLEAVSSRKLFQNTVGRLTKTGNRRIFYVSAVGAKAEQVLEQFTRISKFISSLVSTATQLTKEQIWAGILKEAFKKFCYNENIRAFSDGDQRLLGL